MDPQQLKRLQEAHTKAVDDLKRELQDLRTRQAEILKRQPEITAKVAEIAKEKTALEREAHELTAESNKNRSAIPQKERELHGIQKEMEDSAKALKAALAAK